MIWHVCQSDSCWLTSEKMHCEFNYYWVYLGFWYKGSCCRGFFFWSWETILQSHWFSLILINLRKVIFRKTIKTQHSSFPLPPLSQSSPLHVGNAMLISKIVRMHPEMAFEGFDFFFLIKFILPQSTSLLKLNFCERFHLYQLSYHQTLKQLFLKCF